MLEFLVKRIRLTKEVSNLVYHIIRLAVKNTWGLLNHLISVKSEKSMQLNFTTSI